MSKKNLFPLVLVFLVGAFTMFLMLKPEREEIYEKTSLSKAIDKIYDATVSIETYNGSAKKNIGAGFFYNIDDNYGYILTNNHVVEEGIDVEIITTKDEKVKAEILGKDKYLDIAVLRVDKKYASKIATIGNSKDIKLGDTIFTIGNPLGYRNTITSGIISGKDRLVKVDTEDDEFIMKVIQTDAAINPGTSGGPLLNINGEVIGICSLKLEREDLEGIGFAIPIKYAMNNIEYLEKNEKVVYPTLGIKVTESIDTATLLKNDININQDEYGIIVLEDKLGLKKGDLIIKINKNRIKDILTLNSELLEYKSKDKVELTYIRNGKENKIKITLS